MSTALSMDVFQLNKIMEKTTLNYASLGENSNKFYIIELQEGIGEYPYRVYTNYGRIGQRTPRGGTKPFKSYMQAKLEYDKVIRQKTNKGYVVVEMAEDSYSDVVSIKKPAKLDLSSIDDKVLKFIGKIYQETKSFLISTINTPLGKLSANQVAKGYKILSEIEEALNAGSHNLVYLSNQFYSVIPVSFGNSVNFSRMLIDDYYKLNERKELLGVMSSVLDVQKNLESTLEEKYKALNIKLKALDLNDSEYKRIEQKVKKTRGRNHHFDCEIKNIYIVEEIKGREDFNPYNVEVMELFHGSRNENILGILQHGLKIKPQSAKHTGSMFGSAIYFASSSTKSANYCSSFGTVRYEEQFMFLCNVATGKVKEYSDAQPHLTSAPRGYNSVKGVKGGSLIHDEYMVYRENQVDIRYIIEFERN